MKKEQLKEVTFRQIGELIGEKADAYWQTNEGVCSRKLNDYLDDSTEGWVEDVDWLPGDVYLYKVKIEFSKVGKPVDYFEYYYTFSDDKNHVEKFYI